MTSAPNSPNSFATNVFPLPIPPAMPMMGLPRNTRGQIISGSRAMHVFAEERVHFVAVREGQDVAGAGDDAVGARAPRGEDVIALAVDVVDRDLERRRVRLPREDGSRRPAEEGGVGIGELAEQAARRRRGAGAEQLDAAAGEEADALEGDHACGTRQAPQ